MSAPNSGSITPRSAVRISSLVGRVAIAEIYRRKLWLALLIVGTCHGSANLSPNTALSRRSTVITLTETASTKVAELIAQEGQADLMLRVAVRPGGCSGFSYEMFFDSEKDSEDVVNTEFGVPVVVDPSSAQLLT
ncbi:MAG: iron-sulfur cluster assembly accessory protein, partial [Acidimicrobiia bacterium]|nr:iron-sulfur cluster assembly accessory protein [Acidimicrobiia bacterium]